MAALCKEAGEGMNSLAAVALTAERTVIEEVLTATSLVRLP